ncbi:DNA phosphorothioation-dependent restriction protein DptH [Thalassomonas haliotis]|uniref:DNA phosphorothioation-dependent restriction protein DptH n=1 Tax=Thalassomonas haliotis TaxID=485448 RepID=A0ABY7VIT4_9GAMM|nr:DNA phosphorothioation-dependent restriction protein DptH [Thalassomonas haliotis]WDE13486.1 DNA phosphorothioation-dependent restriction protein DptH [Thalassomonas haliotis]
MLSKPFETFLTEHFLKESVNKLQAGYRYQFQSPDNENSNKLHQAFLALSTSNVRIKEVTIPTVNVGDITLIPVLHNENGAGFSENFISHLRDEVAGQQGQLKDSALLVIHNSMLDTLINSAEDVAQTKGVWDPLSIKEAMKSLINYQDDSHQVSECILEHRFNQILDDGATMFGFVELYQALLDGDLKFIELGLLNDPAILNWNGKQEQINERLDKNKKLFKKLDFITHHFPNELQEKLAEINLGEKFVQKHFGGEPPERWKTELELSDCLQEQAKNLDNSLELEKETLLQGELIAKSKAESKAGVRDRHLVLLLEPDQTAFTLELSFLGGKVEKKQFSIKHNKTDKFNIANPDNTGGKRSRIKITGTYLQQPMFFTLAMKRELTTESHNFKILVISAAEYHVDGFRHNYLIEPAKSRITLQTEDNSFVIAEQGSKAVVEEIGQVFENESISEVDFEQLINESDRLHFIVKGKSTALTFNVEGAIATDSLYLPLMLDQGRFTKLYQNDYYGIFNRSKNKVIIDNKEVAPKGKRLTLLQWEAQLLDDKLLTRKDDKTVSVYLQDIEADYPELYNTYADLFDYFSTTKSLPSINGWGENVRNITSKLVNAYLQAIEAIPYDKLLTQAQKRLVNIGFATFNGEEYLTPYHPLNLAYYLNLANQVVNDETGSFKTLPKVTIERLNAQGLLPFVYHPLHEFSYNQLEKDNCFWLKLLPQQETCYDYISKVVKEKVSEFKDAFSALFGAGARSTLIVNSVNNQKNNELFLGLIDYVKQQKDKVCQIHVNLYDDKLEYTEFDKFAETASYDEIKLLYGLDKGAIREQADAIIDLLRTRLTYSKFENDKVTEQAYAHLSFFRNNNKVEASDVNVEKELSGVVCHGLLAGEAAEKIEGSYFTGFGLRDVNIDHLPHLKIAKLLGTLIKPSRKSNEKHSPSKSISLAVSDSFKSLLDRSYHSSIWTTIIDPKVTLDFFKNAKDYVLIHYSDNYTNSVNYDAITVSKENDIYKKVLEQNEGGITEEFNAFNGEWLLKMIKTDGDARKNENDRKEKKGIIGAYKFVSCLLTQSDITWVPLSVAEMIRVAGNIGLKMSDSDFSRNVHGYKKGLISDDVLFVGFKDQQMYLLPLEVKTGLKQTHKKGVQQAKELKRYLTQDILGRKDLAGNLYRGLFIRQILMQIDKYKLYNLYPETHFEKLLAQREWWMQGDYELAEINNYPEGFLVAFVENDVFFESEFTEVDNILKIQLPISYLKGFVSTPLQELMADICPEKLCHIPEQYLLGVTTAETVVIESKIEDAADTTLLADEPVIEVVEPIIAPAIESPVIETPMLEKIADDTLKVLVGHNVQNEEPILWEPTNTAKFMNTNSGIIGTMGTGKTQCTKSVVTQLYRNQHNNVDSKPIGILIFDYKSDYVDDKFLTATAGKKFNLHKLPYNPLSLFGDTPMLPVHTARGFSETMGKAFGLGQKQQLRLRKLISDAYDLAGIKKADQSTWSKPAPTIADVWSLFIEDEPTEDSLYAALESLHELEIFQDNINKCTSLYELVDGITVVELAGYPTEIQNLVVALTLDLFYSQMQKQGKPEVQGDFRQVTKLLLVDEADNFMSQNFPSLRKVLKEGREYGVGVILSTQDITHFKTNENDYSAYILSWIVHRVGQIKNQDIKSIFNKDDKAAQEQLMKSIRELDKHYSLYVDGDKKVQKIKDKAFWELLNEK